MLFHKHLKVEYSEENILFWLEVEKFKTVSDDNLEKEANAIVTKFVGEDAPKSVRINSMTIFLLLVYIGGCLSIANGHMSPQILTA